ncbi:hypothetical protein HHI36_013391 [Cryptolaemus montrouzieri]|uniref:Uncharacterized protein n=1 Tax=Cryptolaemus montrouzieri TaxID=559131 RepID=A0ABD2NGY3_9CUCU
MTKEEPPEKEKDKIKAQTTFRCHLKQDVNFVVCLVCENVFHLSDFRRLSATRILGEIFVIFNEHTDLDLTLKLDEELLDVKSRHLLHI